MSAKRRILTGIVFLALSASGPGLFGQGIPKGREVPTMPRIWDPGRGSWAFAGLGAPGFVVGFSHQHERSVLTVHGGAYLWNMAFSGSELAVTLGLPLSGGRLFASVGGGLGIMRGKFDPDQKAKTAPCLAADLQLSLRLGSRLGLGFYAPVDVSTKHVVGGFFICLQYGGWKI
jgi:hypothetical protein